MSFEQFEGSSYTTFCKTLIRRQGSAEQEDFLGSLRSRDMFIAWFSEKVQMIEGSPLPTLDTPLTENEYKVPPRDTEEQVFAQWPDLKPADACKATFWGIVTFRHIAEDIIKPFYLAANGGNLSGGCERIDRVLKEADAQEIDKTVRTALRRFSGLREARGHRSVYVDCPFARAWWRQYLANEVCVNTNANKKKVIAVFRETQTYWEKLIGSIVSQNSRLGDSKVRNALIWVLSEQINDKSKSAIFTGSALTAVINQIGIQSAWQELAVFSVVELKEMFENKFFN